MSALESQMPPVQRAPVNGIEMAYYEAGPREGVPIILCHGFPELAFSWRHQLKAFEAAGRWVVAPDQRGYGLSSRPEAVTDYDMEHLTGDLTGLLDHLGVEKAIFCGHDWGGIVVWQLPLMHPGRVAGVIGLNTPFMPRSPLDPIALMRMRFGPDMYIVWFQTPGDADAVLSADVEKTMRFFMRKPAALQAAAAQPAAGGSTFAFKELLQRWDASDTGSQLLTPEELAAFVESFRRTGFTGGINWYRNFTRNWERSEGLPVRIDRLPCLMITAEKDAVLTPAMAEGMPGMIGDLEMHMIHGSGHWTQQEKPEEVNQLILDWLDRRFPK
ncbi:alpha/beta hydrolase [Phenylobacterium sp.]|jgi:pimeloyl-ACP methyl ester carboxylesterase|uniref:alpha/beta fold hydrolase n=1 Tax=Phenylobacterium sp. TaxID=1871053 RepID=UPI002E35CBD6|nr:alpha/beta hydrolase [Phenylobacterium sp.]HEX4710420.1 alpha/beta hydrolase [Phenylobacterium sp.]